MSVAEVSGGWIDFEARGRASAQVRNALVTISETGRFTFNRLAVDKLGGGGTKFILRYNPSEGMIGFKPVGENGNAATGSKAAYKLGIRGSQNGHVLQAKVFFAASGIDPNEVKGRYVLEETDDGTFAIDLSENIE